MTVRFDTFAFLSATEEQEVFNQKKAFAGAFRCNKDLKRDINTLRGLATGGKNRGKVISFEEEVAQLGERFCRAEVDSTQYIVSAGELIDVWTNRTNPQFRNADSKG